MDPLSLAASVIAVVQLAGQVMKLCKEYIGAIQDVPADLRQMLIEISTLKGLFDSLNILVDTGTVSQYVIALSAPAIGCRMVLGELEKLLDESGMEKTVPKGKKGSRLQHTISTTWATLAWPRKRPQAQKMLAELASYKNTINLVLTADIANEMKTLRLHVEQLNDSLSSSERQSILDWLLQTTVDSSSFHNAALQWHEPGTGDWTFQTPEWRTWTSGTKPLLWIYGIPGAGKTVLASYLIETIKTRSKAHRDTAPEGLAYHYCYHARHGSHQDERPKLLAAVINQLCRQIQYIPEKLKFARASGACTLADLMEILQDLGKRFNRINVIIDAVDEAGERRLLLFFLYMLTTHPQLSNLHILATSRDEVDIRRALEPIALTLCMSNPVVDQDIRGYVHRALHSDPKFMLWPSPLLQETEDALVKGAKGMFRWVNCQILTLRTLNKQPAIKKTLHTLPATLDETYERILCSIPEPSKPLAFRALAILCSDWGLRTPLTADMLRDAVLLGDVGVETKEPSDENSRKSDDVLDVIHDQLFNLDALQEVCVCLLAISADAIQHTYTGYRGRYREIIMDQVGRPIQLAHYTVKEYLMSERINKTPASSFHLTADRARQEYLRPILHAALLHNHTLAKSNPNNFHNLACTFLSNLLSLFDPIIASSPDLLHLLTQFLDPATGAFTSLSNSTNGITSINYGLPVSSIQYASSTNQSPPNSPEALILARMIALELEETSFAYIAQIATSLSLLTSLLLDVRLAFDIFSSCTLLDLASASGSQRLCAYLFQLEEFAGIVNENNGRGSVMLRAATKALIFATRHALDFKEKRDRDLVLFLLSRGADPNVRVGTFSALDVAAASRVEARDVQIMEALRQAASTRHGESQSETTSTQDEVIKGRSGWFSLTGLT